MTNVLFGCLVCSITNWTPLAAVPILSSAAGAVANGLCYYVNYGNNPLQGRIIASVLTDLFWLVRHFLLFCSLFSYAF